MKFDNQRASSVIVKRGRESHAGRPQGSPPRIHPTRVPTGSRAPLLYSIRMSQFIRDGGRIEWMRRSSLSVLASASDSRLVSGMATALDSARALVSGMARASGMAKALV